MSTWCCFDGAGEASVLLSAGDEFQGTLFYTTYKSKIVADFMNDMGFTAAATGNHEFDDGPEELAKFIETKLPQAGRLDATQYALLTQACRQAKEVLLSPSPPEKQTVTVVGRGRSVIGGTLHAPLTPATF